MSTTPNPTESTAGYCQNCGKPMTASELRTVGGMVYCEPCLAQRLGVPIAGQPVPPSAAYPGAPYVPVRRSPVLAAVLGFIPGVGAMYNGQVAKGLVHVMIFVALIGAADHFGPFGILIAGWVFYQVFDAYQTAEALSRGMAPPDYLGLNQIASRLGLTQQPPPQPAPPVEYPVPPAAPYASGPIPPAPGFVAPGFVPPAAPLGYVPPPDPGFTPGLSDEPVQHQFPIGAVVLIALGVLFMLGTAGVMSMHWMHHGWPILLIVLGVAIVLRNNSRFRGGPR
jgi:TM2 domain-containing membrane protein YozV